MGRRSSRGAAAAAEECDDYSLMADDYYAAVIGSNNNNWKSQIRRQFDSDLSNVISSHLRRWRSCLNIVVVVLANMRLCGPFRFLSGNSNRAQFNNRAMSGSGFRPLVATNCIYAGAIQFKSRQFSSAIYGRIVVAQARNSRMTLFGSSSSIR